MCLMHVCINTVPVPDAINLSAIVPITFYANFDKPHQLNISLLIYNNMVYYPY